MNQSSNATARCAEAETDAFQSRRNRGFSTQRWLSLAELALGSAIVIGHNVYHRIPNEVPILRAWSDFGASA